MKGIPLKTWEVQAALGDRKSVTRRVVKPQPKGQLVPTLPGGCWPGYFEEVGTSRVQKPPYRPGDILYVREKWAKEFGVYWYSADLESDEPGQIPGMICKTKWRPSIHMPREAARIFLRVKDVRVERLQEIGHDGIAKEGVATKGTPGSPERINPFYAFKELWDSTIKPKDRALYGWEANPFVWVIEFERISKDEVIKNA